MNMKKLSIYAATLALAFSASAVALKQDTQEFRAEGHFDPETYGGGEFEVSLTYGYFIMDDLEVGGRIHYLDNDVTSLFSLGTFVEYNFDLEREVLPFVGVALDYVTSDTGLENNSAVALSGYAGVRYFLTENIAIGAQVRLTAASAEVFASEDGGAENTDITVLFGMSYFLPP